MEEFNTLVIIGICVVGRDGLGSGLVSCESISVRASRFSHGVPGIGAHGFIMQARSGTFHRLYSDQAALIIVRSGIKRLSSSLHSCEALPGQAVALPMGREWTVVNEAADVGGYQADVLTFSPELVEAYATAKTRQPGDTFAFEPDDAMDEALRRLCRSLAQGIEPGPLSNTCSAKSSSGSTPSASVCCRSIGTRSTTGCARWSPTTFPATGALYA